MALAQARNENLRIAGEHAGLGGGEEVNGFAGDRGLIWENFAERAADGAQKLGQIGADGLFRRAQLEGEQAAGREMCARQAEKLHGVEAVQLRGLRIGHVDEDGVESFFGFGQESSAIEKMQMHARVGIKDGGLRGEVLAREGDQRGVEFDVVEALDGGMLERLGDAAVHAAADQEHTARRRVLQAARSGRPPRLRRDRARWPGWSRSRRGYGFRAGSCRRQWRSQRARFVSGFGDGQVAVDGVALGDDVEAAPEAGASRSVALRARARASRGIAASAAATARAATCTRCMRKTSAEATKRFSRPAMDAI